MVTLYGIKRCDTMKRARAWLDQRGIEYRFVDYQASGAPETDVRRWIEAEGWEKVLNRRGATWRKLPEADREGMNEERALETALAHPSVIRRPILQRGKHLLVGFDEEAWARAFD